VVKPVVKPQTLVEVALRERDVCRDGVVVITKVIEQWDGGSRGLRKETWASLTINASAVEIATSLIHCLQLVWFIAERLVPGGVDLNNRPLGYERKRSRHRNQQATSNPNKNQREVLPIVV
jgi:hypothetical protein